MTEMLGEYWHGITLNDLNFRDGHLCACGERVHGTIGPTHRNRTFLTPADVFAVKDAIVKMGKWTGTGGFMTFASNEFHNKHFHHAISFGTFEDWLFRTVNEKGEPHFCQLAVDWRKEGRTP